MKLTELEMKLILSVPATFDILLAKMKIENIGTNERRVALAQHAEGLRAKLGEF